MISKKALAETIIIQKSGGRPSSDNNIDYRDVYDVIDMCYAQLASQEVMMQIRGKGDFTIDSIWVKALKGTISFDKELNLCYVELPATRVYVEGDKDIRLVTWLQSQDHPFQMEDSASQQAMSLLECGVPEANTYPFYADGQRLYFRTMPKQYKGKKLLIRMIPNVDGYSDDEILPIPTTFAYQLTEMVAAFFGVQITTLSKNTNDSNVNTK